MSLENDWTPGQVLTAAFFDSVVTQINANTAEIALKADADGGNLTADNVTALLAALGIGQIKIQTDGITSLGLFAQASDPDTTNPGRADETDSALWFYPAGS